MPFRPRSIGASLLAELISLLRWDDHMTIEGFVRCFVKCCDVLSSDLSTSFLSALSSESVRTV